jgi:hypothetical protein
MLRFVRLLAVSLALLSASVLGEPVASARSNFPIVVKNSYGLVAEPDCSLCHSGLPSRASANSKFLQSLRTQVTPIANDATLQAALSKAKAASIDSDGDGTSDFAELQARTDPNLTPDEEAKEREQARKTSDASADATGEAPQSPETPGTSGCMIVALNNQGAHGALLPWIFAIGLASFRVRARSRRHARKGDN